MGFFSFKTHDTHKSIWNWHTGLSFPVQMTDNKGNRWIEDSYSGYGMFGGKDYYELLAEMNGKTTREEGILFYFGISCIRNKKTLQIFKGSGVEFFNWSSEKLVDNKSANELLETGEWEQHHLDFKNILYPNLTEDMQWTWRNERTDDCPWQGFFSDEDEDDVSEPEEEHDNYEDKNWLFDEY
jgi:hypothetical protein